MKKIIALSAAVCLILAIVLVSLIKVRFECRSQFGACPDAILKKINSLNGKNLYSARTRLSKALKGDPQVSDFSTQFKLPNTIVANLLLLSPKFAILDRGGNKTYLVSGSGIVLGESTASSLPTVIQSGSIPNVFTLNIVSGVYEMYGVQKGEIVNSSLVIELPGPVRVIFPVSGGDSQVLLGSLRLIYTKVMMPENLGKYSEIDLRFKNPVLR